MLPTLLAYDAGLNFADGIDDWSKYLKIIQYTYNTTPNRMTTYAPSQIIFGTQLRTGIDDIELTGNEPKEYIDYIANKITIIRNNANEKQKIYDKLRKKNYDKNRNISKLEVGDKILYDISTKSVGNKRKLKPHYVGPYEIIEIKNDGQNIKLRDIYDKDNTFNGHIKYVKIYHEDLESPETLLLNHINTELQYTHVNDNVVKDHQLLDIFNEQNTNKGLIDIITNLKVLSV